jgi:type I restriction enzyme R subunit
MANKEATARIKINKLLEAADWRFFADGTKPANIRLEPSVTIKSSDLEALGKNFEKKIQATLARIWGEDEPAQAEA